MSINVREPERKFTPAPEGLFAAVCIDVVEHPNVETQWGTKDKVEVRWELDEINPDTHAPFQVRAWFTSSLHEKAKLRTVLEMWRGKKFTAQELKGFDLEKLIGVTCQVQIVHTPGDEGKVWANVQAVIKAGKHTPLLKPSADYVREINRPKDRQATQAIHDEPDTFPAADEDSIPF